MKNVISKMKDNVNQSLSSIFTKEDVFKILVTIEEQSEESDGSSVMSHSKIKEVLEDLRSILSDVEDIEVETDDIEFSIEGREIVVDNVEVRGKDEVESQVQSLIEKLEEVLDESC